MRFLVTPVNKALNYYREHGMIPLLKRFPSYVASRMQGGLTSRPTVSKFSRLLNPLFNQAFRYKFGPEVDIMNEEWDTLILLDACRYDDFSRQHELPGTIESRISRGADSPEFIKKNFVGRQLHDTVYVTANPHVQMLEEDVFHAVIDTPISDWDATTKCVRPKKVTKAAKRAHEAYSDKRIIVHYMQPHDPPLGQTGNELRQQMDLGGVNADNKSGETRLFEAVADGEIEVERAREAYRETLDIVLKEVEELVSDISGRIVVSSDHGEMFGEQPYPILGRLYEHYRHPHTIELCKVPWLVIQGPRRHTVSESPTSTEDSGYEDLEEKLEALGYK